MKKKSKKNKGLQSRSDLINRSRTSNARESLPPKSDDMFDELRDFKPGARQYIDFSNSKKP